MWKERFQCRSHTFKLWRLSNRPDGRWFNSLGERLHRPRGFYQSLLHARCPCCFLCLASLKIPVSQRLKYKIYQCGAGVSANHRRWGGDSSVRSHTASANSECGSDIAGSGCFFSCPQCTSVQNVRAASSAKWWYSSSCTRASGML